MTELRYRLNTIREDMSTIINNPNREEIEKDEKFVLASFCDPRIKCCFFQEKSTKDFCIEKMTLLIQNKLQNVALVPSNQNISNDESNLSYENSFEKTMNEIVKKNSQNSSNDDFDLFTNTELIREAVLRYTITSTIKLSGNPLEYWKFRCSLTEKPWTREFANIAKKYLTPPATSADIERLFSVASRIISHKRNRTLPENAEKHLFLHENMGSIDFQY